MIKIVSFILKEFLSLFFESKSSFKTIKGKHIDQECYIFGDGVSLKYLDLSNFSDKPAIAGNNFIFHKDFNKVNVLYYAIFEPYWFCPIFFDLLKRNKIRFNKIQSEKRKLIRENKDILFFSDLSNSLFFRSKNILFISRKIKNILTLKIFKQNSVNCFSGCLNVQITIAIFLGFKKAFLVGHDYTHSKSLSGHFYEKGEGIPNKNNKWNNIFLSLASKHIELVTVTIDGDSDTLNSVKYNPLSNISFKENCQIVTKNNRMILSSWPDYNI